MSDITIYSIGHSNVPASKIIELLRKFKIQVLVDVRSSPYSKYCLQFNRDILEMTLHREKFEYVYAGKHLGGRPKDPTCYKDGQLPEENADYLHLVDYPVVMTKDFFQKGIERLMAIAQGKRVAVMCSEEDPAICHRHHLIGKYLVQEGVNVLHIRGDGNTVKDEYLPNLKQEPLGEQLSLF